MKAILMSIKPQWVEKILNKEKTIEIRKRFPKDYVGWVYIYVTKRKPYITGIYNYEHKIVYGDIENKNHNINGKVIARFWCDKVEEIKLNLAARFFTKSMNEEELLKQSCLTSKELENYLWSNICCGYAIHITKLEIFDRPKEIGEFMKVSCKGCPFENTQTCHNNTDGRYCKLTRAPQSWQFIEI